MNDIGDKSTLAIETRGLTKRYGDTLAVDNLDLKITQGEVFGLLGPNGSGKTTTILMMLGLTEPTAGQVRVLDFDPARQPLSVKSRVGYLPDQIGFYDDLTARQNLIYIAKLNGIRRSEYERRIADALERVGLAEHGDQAVKTFSRGMRQRLGVADLLIKQPAIMIMDEPTLGLDPEAARDFLDVIRGFKQEGITILLPSHLLYQVQAVCDRVGLFHQGRMMLEGSVRELAREVLGGGYRVLVEARGPADVLEPALAALPHALEVEHNQNGTYMVAADEDIRAQAAKAVIQAGGELVSLSMEEPNLDDVYATYFREVEHERTS
jgi:ABC-2 type transport system ATP-binding protein